MSETNEILIVIKYRFRKFKLEKEDKSQLKIVKSKFNKIKGDIYVFLKTLRSNVFKCSYLLPIYFAHSQIEMKSSKTEHTQNVHGSCDIKINFFFLFLVETKRASMSSNHLNRLLQLFHFFPLSVLALFSVFCF